MIRVVHQEGKIRRLVGLLENQITYTPPSGFTGSEAFTFRVSDATATSAPAPFTLSVRPLPRIEGFVPTDAKEHRLWWSEADESVRIEMTPELTPTAAWHEVATPYYGATNWLLAAPTNGPSVFYRLRAP